MGRKCSVLGCISSVGLHIFPQDFKIRQQWLRLIGLEDDSELPPGAGVCKLHFARDSFANLMEFEMGFAKRLILKPEGIPTLALPVVRQKPHRQVSKLPTLLPRPQGDNRPESRATREIGCQTDHILTKHEFVQANLKPIRRSKATQARAFNRSVACETETLMEARLHQVAFMTQKRKRCEMSASDPNLNVNATSSSVNSTSSPCEVPPHKKKKYVVHEDQLLGLFQICPACTNRCTVDTTTTGSLLRVTQQCPGCDYFNQWFSQPTVDSAPS
ncbi:PREDICTED: uncharacterized protein LOC107098306 [Cyprinodon variegatus]|uniref:uncharacterized protein LOC107098306 n=1 Tax=Cyprinodon variegatus TaxID=28743 RepID=UPI000742C155|nr:PREDICTED: uncharacterized protein LOC107098306 [Cyprinodon variegatus]